MSEMDVSSDEDPIDRKKTKKSSEERVVFFRNVEAESLFLDDHINKEDGSKLDSGISNASYLWGTPPPLPKRDPRVKIAQERAEQRKTESAYERIRSRAFVPGILPVDESEKDIQNLPPALLFHNISYSIHSQKRIVDWPKNTKIIDGVSGFARSGELLAILGCSGAGKTTLLDVLAARKDWNKVTGSIYYAGLSMKQPPLTVCTFVRQQDIHLPQLTVKQTLYYAARLRGVREKKRKIAALLEQLRLEHIADSRVGNDLQRGISGGEKRRLSVAVELLSEPLVLFCDEPTSGLDSVAALTVVRLLKVLAKKRGTAVVMTVHQPSVDLFMLFDRVMVLSKGSAGIGRVMYFGQGGDVVDDYLVKSLKSGWRGGFSKKTSTQTRKSLKDSGIVLGTRTPLLPDEEEVDRSLDGDVDKEAEILFSSAAVTQGNICDHLLSLACGENTTGKENEEKEEEELEEDTKNMTDKSLSVFEVHRRKKIDDVVDKWQESDQGKNTQTELDGMLKRAENEKGVITSKRLQGWKPLPIYTQIFWLSMRKYRCYLNEWPLFIGLRIAKPIALGVMTGTAFICLSQDDQSGVVNTISLLFFTLMLTYLSAAPYFDLFPSERLMFVHERSARLYDAFAYFIATFVAILPTDIVMTLVFCCLIYFPACLNLDGPGKFFIFFLIVLITSIIMIAYVLALGAFLATADDATGASAGIYSLMILLSGFFIIYGSIPVWWRWATWISPYRYGLAAIMYNQYENIVFDCGDPTEDSRTTTRSRDAQGNVTIHVTIKSSQFCTYQTGLQLLDSYNSNLGTGGMWGFICALFGFAFISLFLCYLGLKVMKWGRR